MQKNLHRPKMKKIVTVEKTKKIQSMLIEI